LTHGRLASAMRKANESRRIFRTAAATQTPPDTVGCRVQKIRDAASLPGAAGE
jgi:hypothetical protein